jgi:hypothetical protein
MLLALTSAVAQATRMQTLDAFAKVNLEGNIELHLVKSTQSSVKIETKNDEDLEDLFIEIKGKELFLAYKENRNNTPKFKVYLEHTGIDEVSMSGLVSLFSEDILNESDLTLNGSGIVKGEIEVAVENFRIDSDGITNLSISGTADNAIFNIDGLAKINTKNLNAKSVQQHTDGFTKVKVGS